MLVFAIRQEKMDTYRMRPHLEKEVTEIQNQEQYRHTVTHGKEIGTLTGREVRAVCVGSARAERKVESGRDKDGNDSDKQQRRVELCSC